MSILIVDDTLSQQLLLSAVLRSAGYGDVMTAPSAEQAFERLSDDGAAGGEPDVDLILMDISMPDVDGIEACRRIKAQPSWQDIPVIMVTASTETEDLQAAFAAGALDYITKPPKKDEMLARVRSALNLKREMDARKARERQLLDYVEQVGHVTDAAAAVEARTFDPVSLNGVAARSDALGQLARVFERMAGEVYAREERLKQQVQELRIQIDEGKKEREVAEITESDYFRTLQEKARQLRAGQ
jgi:CheY-like chemotaxis protein/HAMP domain-containing protein